MKYLEARPSRSDAARGVLRNRIILTNQHGVTVLEYMDAVLVKRRSRTAN